MNFEPIMLRAKGRLYNSSVAYEKGRIYIKFRFNRTLLKEIKNMSGAKWHGFDTPPRKLWSIADNQRNRFQLDYLQGNNPYELYDVNLIDIDVERPLYVHQIEAAKHMLTRKRCILAGEMGVGKTLAAIVAMEKSGVKDWWWVGPKSAIKSVELELLKWESRIFPRLLTYDALRSLVKTWDGAAPQGIVLDESARVKNETAQRTQAAMHVANAIRTEHDGFVWLMTGTPAPKAPTDWYSQCLSSDVWIVTTEGLRQISDLIDRETTIHIDGHSILTNGFFKTGHKQLYRITTKEGYSVKATEDHKFLVDYDGIVFWKELRDIEIGDTICISESTNTEWEGLGSKDDGYILGLLFGDGTVCNKDNFQHGTLQFFEDDYCLIPEVLRILQQNNVSSNGRALRIHGGTTNKILREWGITIKKNIDLNMLKASSDFIKGFLRGIFDFIVKFVLLRKKMIHILMVEK